MKSDDRNLSCWLAKLIAADGCISDSEIDVLKQMSNDFNLDVGNIISLAEVLADKCECPDVVKIDPSLLKGIAFEKFVVGLTGSCGKFKLIDWRSDKKVSGIFPLSSLLPDLSLDFHKDYEDHKIFIECKYRSNIPTWKFSIRNFKRYSEAASDHGRDLFFALGFGGSPSDPALFFIVPSDGFDTGGSVKMQDLFNFRPRKSHKSVLKFFNSFYR